MTQEVEKPFIQRYCELRRAIAVGNGGGSSRFWIRRSFENANLAQKNNLAANGSCSGPSGESCAPLWPVDPLQCEKMVFGLRQHSSTGVHTHTCIL